MRCVGDVEALRPELQIHRPRQFEGAEEAQIQIPLAGAAHAVPAHVSEPDFRDPLERGRVEVRGIPDVAEDLDRIFNLIRGLLVVRHVQRGAGPGQRKRPPRVGAEDAIQLPPSKDGIGETGCRPRFSGAERELPHSGQLEVVRRIERRERAVAIEDARSVP